MSRSTGVSSVSQLSFAQVDLNVITAAATEAGPQGIKMSTAEGNALVAKMKSFGGEQNWLNQAWLVFFNTTGSVLPTPTVEDFNNRGITLFLPLRDSNGQSMNSMLQGFQNADLNVDNPAIAVRFVDPSNSILNQRLLAGYYLDFNWDQANYEALGLPTDISYGSVVPDLIGAFVKINYTWVRAVADVATISCWNEDAIDTLINRKYSGVTLRFGNTYTYGQTGSGGGGSGGDWSSGGNAFGTTALLQNDGGIEMRATNANETITISCPDLMTIESTDPAGGNIYINARVAGMDSTAQTYLTTTTAGAINFIENTGSGEEAWVSIESAVTGGPRHLLQVNPDDDPPGSAATRLAEYNSRVLDNQNAFLTYGAALSRFQERTSSLINTADAQLVQYSTTATAANDGDIVFLNGAVPTTDPTTATVLRVNKNNADGVPQLRYNLYDVNTRLTYRHQNYAGEVDGIALFKITGAQVDGGLYWEWTIGDIVVAVGSVFADGDAGVLDVGNQDAVYDKGNVLGKTLVVGTNDNFPVSVIANNQQIATFQQDGLIVENQPAATYEGLVAANVGGEAIPNKLYTDNAITALGNNKVTKGGDTDGAPLVMGTIDKQPVQMLYFNTNTLELDNGVIRSKTYTTEAAINNRPEQAVIPFQEALRLQRSSGRLLFRTGPNTGYPGSLPGDGGMTVNNTTIASLTTLALGTNGLDGVDEESRIKELFTYGTAGARIVFTRTAPESGQLILETTDGGNDALHTNTIVWSVSVVSNEFGATWPQSTGDDNYWGLTVPVGTTADLNNKLTIGGDSIGGEIFVGANDNAPFRLMTNAAARLTIQEDGSVVQDIDSATYETLVKAIGENAIPNKRYVDNAILPKAPANGIYSNRYEWTTSTAPTAGQITSLTLGPDTYADLATATHIRIHESDLNGARWFWPLFGGSGSLLSWQCARVPVDETPLSAIEGIGFNFPQGHTVTGPVSGYYTVNITGGFQTAPPSAGNQYNIQIGPYDVFLSNLKGQFYDDLPYASTVIATGTGYDIATLATVPVVVPLTEVLQDTGNNQFSINAPSSGIITYDPTNGNSAVFKVTLDARVYSSNVQDERISVFVEIDQGGGFSQQGEVALSYSSTSLSICQKQGSVSFNVALNAGDTIRVSLAATDGVTAPAQPSTFLVNIESISLNINVINVP